VIRVHLDKLLADRGMTLTELSDLVGVTVVNLSILKNGHAKAIRFSTLAALCEALHCQPGDLLEYEDARALVIKGLRLSRQRRRGRKRRRSDQPAGPA
jgi:putative transcriptional regulator